jgi:hypothetical protein
MISMVSLSFFSTHFESICQMSQLPRVRNTQSVGGDGERKILIFYAKEPNEKLWPTMAHSSFLKKMKDFLPTIDFVNIFHPK